MTQSTATRSHPRRVDFTAYRQDRDALKYAAYGLSPSAIARRTGLTRGQVMYRYRVKAAVRLSDWREKAFEEVDRMEAELKRCDGIVERLRREHLAGAKGKTKKR